MDPIGAIIGMVMLVAIALYAAIGIQSARHRVGNARVHNAPVPGRLAC
jgi:hypothetical protein